MGVVFFAALGSHPDRADYVAAMMRLIGFDLFLVVAAMALTSLLPRRPAGPAVLEAVADQSGLELELEATSPAA